MMKFSGFVVILLCCLPVSVQAAERVLTTHPTLQAMHAENNRLRLENGRAAQGFSEELTQAAQEQAEYMARTRSFGHNVNGTPGGRAMKHRFPGNFQGEIIAMGGRTVVDTFRQWRNSSGHWGIILNGSSQAGFGYARSNGGAGYWVGLYGSPAAAIRQLVISNGSGTSSVQSRIRGIFRRRR